MLRSLLVLGLVVLGACVASVAVPTVEARPTCSPFPYVEDPDIGGLVSCIEQDVPCLPRPCG